MPLPKEKEVFTYGMYKTWPDEERWEIIEGVPYDMSPAPSRFHQDVFRELFNQIVNKLSDKSCIVYSAPFREWTELYQIELQENWNLAREHEQLKRIPALE